MNELQLRLKRIARKATYTIGRLFVENVRFCDTLEDTDRGLKQTDSLASINTRKVYGETAIPAGKYEVVMNVVSPKYAAVDWYKRNCNGGRMPRLKSVPGYEGVLIHPGNTAIDTLGCVLVGKNTVVGKLTQSRDTFAALYKKLKAAADAGKKIVLTIE